MTQVEALMKRAPDDTQEQPLEKIADQITEFLRRVVEPETAVELRAFEVAGGGTFTRRYRTDQLHRLAWDALDRSGQCRGIYFTLNPLAPSLLSEGRSATIKDVLRRRWLLVDANPRRPGKVSATDVEKAAARLVIEAGRAVLRGTGWPEPILCDSGNGYHLLYRIDLPTEDSGLVKRVLAGLGDAFDTRAVQIDRKVHDAVRICKLPYTMVCKGEDTPERPYRLARVVEMPAELTPVTREQLEAIAGREAKANGEETEADHRVIQQTGPQPVVPPEYLPQVVKWARNYVKRMDPAIEGQHGDIQTYTVICTLANDFALPLKAAWPILLEWNARCEPPWDERDLLRKWEIAEKTAKGRRGKKIAPYHIRRALRVQEDRQENPRHG